MNLWKREKGSLGKNEVSVHLQDRGPQISFLSWKQQQSDISYSAMCMNAIFMGQLHEADNSYLSNFSSIKCWKPIFPFQREELKFAFHVRGERPLSREVGVGITFTTKCTLVSSVSPSVGKMCSWGRGWKRKARKVLSAHGVCILPTVQPWESTTSVREVSSSPASSLLPPVSPSSLSSSGPPCRCHSIHLLCYRHYSTILNT